MDSVIWTIRILLQNRGRNPIWAEQIPDEDPDHPVRCQFGNGVTENSNFQALPNLFNLTRLRRTSFSRRDTDLHRPCGERSEPNMT